MILSNPQTFINQQITTSADVSFIVPTGCVGTLDGCYCGIVGADPSANGNIYLAINETIINFITFGGNLTLIQEPLLELVQHGFPLITGDNVSVIVDSIGVSFNVIVWGTLSGGGTF